MSEKELKTLTTKLRMGSKFYNPKLESTNPHNTLLIYNKKGKKYQMIHKDSNVVLMNEVYCEFLIDGWIELKD